jgi:hypothetical protein
MSGHMKWETTRHRREEARMTPEKKERLRARLTELYVEWLGEAAELKEHGASQDEQYMTRKASATYAEAWQLERCAEQIKDLLL